MRPTERAMPFIGYHRQVTFLAEQLHPAIPFISTNPCRRRRSRASGSGRRPNSPPSPAWPPPGPRHRSASEAADSSSAFRSDSSASRSASSPSESPEAAPLSPRRTGAPTRGGELCTSELRGSPAPRLGLAFPLHLRLFCRLPSCRRRCCCCCCCCCSCFWWRW